MTACDDDDDDDGPLCKVDLERDPTKVEGRVSDVARAAAGRRGVRHERSTSAYLSRLLVDPVAARSKSKIRRTTRNPTILSFSSVADTE